MTDRFQALASHIYNKKAVSLYSITMNKVARPPFWPMHFENLPRIDENYSFDPLKPETLMDDNNTLLSVNIITFDIPSFDSNEEDTQKKATQAIERENSKLQEKRKQLEELLAAMQLDGNLYRTKIAASMRNMQRTIDSLQNDNTGLIEQCKECETKIIQLRDETLLEQNQIDAFYDDLEKLPWRKRLKG
jgi:hypothetical protein